MSKTNCFLPSKGFCLNFRVRMVKSLIASAYHVSFRHGQMQEGGPDPQLE